jgi:hypothetical protein
MAPGNDRKPYESRGNLKPSFERWSRTALDRCLVLIVERDPGSKLRVCVVFSQRYHTLRTRSNETRDVLCTAEARGLIRDL